MKELFESNLCRCNNCNLVLVDQNPQIGALPSKVFSDKDGQWVLQDGETEVAEMQYSEEGYWLCPVCETDEFLQDEI